jgi:hypothetical protein
MYILSYPMLNEEYIEIGWSFKISAGTEPPCRFFLNAIPRSAKHYISNSPGVCRREDAFLGKSVVI